jgi:hypothetical protein
MGGDSHCGQAPLPLSYAASVVMHFFAQTTQRVEGREQHVVHSATEGVPASAVAKRTGTRTATAAQAVTANARKSRRIVMVTPGFR